jgi:DNA-binding MarR family transcriptional regulator
MQFRLFLAQSRNSGKSFQMKRNSEPGDRMASQLPLAQFLPYQINVLARRMSEDLARIYGERFGITIPEWRVLAHLADEAHVSIRDIHRKVAMDKVKVTRAAQRLERIGLIRKETQAEDRRLVALSLTEAGRDMFGQIVPLARHYEEQVLSKLSEDDLHRFRQLLTRLLEL